jgi:exopolysaccharide production protein ExoQ
VHAAVGTRDDDGPATDRPARSPRSGDALGSWYTAAASVLLSGPVGIPVRTSAAGLCALAVAALALRRTSARDVYVPASVILFAAWCAVSVSWSEDPGETGLDAAALALATLAAIASANTFSARSMIRGLIYGGVVMAVSSVLVEVVNPGPGTSHDVVDSGGLQGIYEHRNLLSGALALGLVTAVSGGWAFGPRPVLRFVLPAVVAACTIAAQSITAVASIGAAFAVGLALAALRRLPRNDRTLAAVGFGALVALVIILLSGNSARVIQSVGRDPTLTGRTDIWTAVWTEITERPWLGQGWGAVWDIGDPAGDYVRGYIGYFIDHSHSGALDIWIQVGAVGLALAVAVLASFGVIAVRAYFRGPTQLGIWPLTVLAVVLFYNVSEAQLVRPLNWWFVVVAAVVLLLRERAAFASSAAERRAP